MANEPEAAGWRADMRVVTDTAPATGALGGLLTAVTAAPAPVVVVAWDMPLVTAELLRVLADGLDRPDACLPASGGPRGVEPLCAAYGPACAAPIERAIAAGRSSRDRIPRGRPRGYTSRLADVAVQGEPARLFFNVNTADDLTLANELA